MKPGQIGLLLAAGTWARLLANPVIGHIADRSGQRKRLMVGLALASLAAFAMFEQAEGFPALFAVSLVFGCSYAPLTPLGETLTLVTVYARGLDYGRIRLWGSISFIVAAVLVGRLLVDAATDVILWTTLFGLGSLALVCAFLPDLRAPPSPPSAMPIRRLLSEAPFLLFLASASLIQASHAALYGFATLHWRSAGHSPDAIGWLWAESVIAEIVLFAFGAKLLRRIGPVSLLILGAAAGILRWTVTGLATDLGALVLLQALHAFTFGAAHLGAMHCIARSAPAGTAATAQSLYASVSSGAAMGLAMPLAGLLYQVAGGEAAFLSMAVLSGLGMLGSVTLALGWPSWQRIRARPGTDG